MTDGTGPFHEPRKRPGPPPRSAGPPEVDQAARAQLLRVTVYFGPACFSILGAMWYFLVFVRGALPGWSYPFLLLLDVPLTVAGVFGVYHATTRTAVGFTNIVLAAGNIAAPPSYPRQEVLIARGEYREAAEYFEDHIRVDPADVEARLRLADLLERQLSDPAGAERVYLDARRAHPTPREEARIANALIDLYRKMDRRDRLVVELARYADRYRGTRAGDAAARELRQIKTSP